MGGTDFILFRQHVKCNTNISISIIKIKSMKPKISKKTTICLLSFLMIMPLISCRKLPDFNQLSSNLVAITNRDGTAQFNTYTTYFISDTIAYISNVANSDTIITGSTAASIVNAVKTNMNSRGYQFTSLGSNPDIGIKVTAINKVNGTISFPPGWWWGHPGYPGGCYWGWCYPNYYPFPVIFGYKIGDIIVEVLDLKNASSNDLLKVIWVLDGTGEITSSTQTNTAYAINAINQGYLQSPYFKRN